jgi:hypothetical protein
VIKPLKKVGIAGTYLNIIMVVYYEPIPNIVLNADKLKAFPQSQEWNKGDHSVNSYST